MAKDFATELISKHRRVEVTQMLAAFNGLNKVAVDARDATRKISAAFGVPITALPGEVVEVSDRSILTL